MTKPVCPKHPMVTLQPIKKGWYCEACDARIVSDDQHPQQDTPLASEDTDITLINELPTLIALSLADGLNEGAPQVALWALADVAEIALKMVVMAGVGEHLVTQSSLPDQLVAALRDNVELPTMGQWMGMAHAVAKHAPNTSAVPLRATADALGALLGGRNTPPDIGLLTMRNRLAHGGAVGRTEATRLLAIWRPRIREWVPNALRWLCEARLIAIDAVGRRVLLRGPHGTQLSPAEGTPLPADAPAGSVWLCMGERALPLGPLGTFDLGTSAPQIYVRSGEVRLEYLRLGVDGGIVDADVGVLEQFRELFLPKFKPMSGMTRFTIRDFGDEIRHEAARRIGRERELETLEAAIRDLQSSALWLTGPAGIGKSNLMATLMLSLEEHTPKDTLVLPYRFRAGDDRCGRSPFLTYLRERLFASDALIPEKSKVEFSEDGSERRSRMNPNDTLAFDPVQEVRDLLARLLPERRVLLILDGLDEIAERDSRFVPDVLFRLRGKRLTFIAAGRAERGLSEAFREIGAFEPFPKGLPPMSEDDVRALLLLRTGPARRRLLEGDKEAFGEVRNAFVERVARQSDGLPVYVNYVIGDLNAGRLSPDQTNGLPPSLHAYHDELLRRAAVGDLQTITTPTLVLLSLAYEPLSTQEIATLLVRNSRLATPDEGLVERALQAIGAMVKKASDPDGKEGYALFHHSLRTHILGSKNVEQTVCSLRTAFADASRRPEGDAVEVYLYRCGVRHMLDAGRPLDALALLTNFDLVMARFLRLEPTGRAADEWYADWERVRTQIGVIEEAQVWWNFARFNRHLFKRKGWESWRVLFQAAMDHADDSPVTLAAEAYEARGARTWAWLRWLNRPKVYRGIQSMVVFVGHNHRVRGAQALPDGRVLSWSDDDTLRLWDGQTGDSLAVLEGHTYSVVGAHQLADGRLLSWSDDRTLRLWDGQTGAPLAVLKGHGDEVAGARQLTDGRLLSWSDDHTLRLWDGQTGALLAVLKGHRRSVFGAHQLADGRVLSWSEDGMLRLWDGQTGAPLAVLRGHARDVNGAHQLADGRLLSWSADDTLRLWDGQTGSPLSILEGHTYSVVGAHQLADGRVLSWSDDHTLRLWDGQTGDSLAVLEGHRRSVVGAHQLADGRLLSWSEDGTLRLWDGQTGAPLTVLERRASSVAKLVGIFGAYQLADGRLLSWSDDSTLRLWDGQTGKSLAALEGHNSTIRGAHQLADGRLLSWSQDGTLRLWDVQTITPFAVLEGHTGDVLGAHQLADGRVLSWSNDFTLRLWDGQTGACILKMRGSADGAHQLADGRLLLWRNGWLQLLDEQNFAELAKLKGHTGGVVGAHQLADGRLLSWSSDGTLRLWDGQTGAPLVVLEGHTGGVVGAHQLADGRLLSWSYDGTLRLWDEQTGAELAVLEGSKSSVRGARQLVDGRLLSWSNYRLRLWDEQTGAELAVLKMHKILVVGAQQLADGRLLSWSEDGTLRLWDGETGAELAVLKGHTGKVVGVQQLADGRLLSWSDFDHTTRLWDVNTGLLLRVFAHPSDWTDAGSEVLAPLLLRSRVLHHTLHLGYDVKDFKRDLVVFSNRRHLRLCRFIPCQA